MNFSRGYMDKTRDRVLQVELHVEFDGRFCLTKMSPGVHVQAQVDDRRVDGKDRAFEFDLKLAVAAIQPTSLIDQPTSEVGKEAPVTRFIGSRQRGLGNRPSDAHVVELRSVRIQAKHRVAQTLAVRHLPERHAQKLLPAAKVPRSLIAFVSLHPPIEVVMIDKRNDLRKNVLAFVHMNASLRRNARLISNRLESKQDLTPYLTMFSKNYIIA